MYFSFKLEHMENSDFSKKFVNVIFSETKSLSIQNKKKTEVHKRSSPVVDVKHQT